MDSQISARQTTIGETMMEYINTWLHSNINSNDEKLLNYTNEACINKFFVSDSHTLVLTIMVSLEDCNLIEQHSVIRFFFYF
jgi:hypothetical protein